ncbi:MAG: PH domain-containing protein [Akkermansiaceae bacterium]
MNSESTQWKGSPSQWLNIGHFGLAILATIAFVIGGFFFPPLFIGLLFPAGYALWRYLTVRCQIFELTTERLRITTGVINQNIDEIELYRVKDFVIERKWWMRIVGLGNIHLQTSDRSLPIVDIPAIDDCIELRETLRKLVEAMRDKKRVREMDFDETGGDDSFGDMDEIG